MPQEVMGSSLGHRDGQDTLFPRENEWAAPGREHRYPIFQVA